jgi:hypothetical protein
MLCALAAALTAQTRVSSTFAYGKRAQLPATCTAGQVYKASDVLPSLYLCNNGAWVAQADPSVAVGALSTVIADGEYNAFAHPAGFPDGSVMISFRRATNANTSLGLAVTSSSTDGGHTWSAPATAVSCGSLDCRDPSITRLSSGVLAMSYFSYDSTSGDSWVYVVKSTGPVASAGASVTWGAPVAVPTTMIGTGAACSAPVVEALGGLVLPVYGQLPGDAYDSSVLMYSSGGAWSALSTIAEGQTYGQNFDEPNAAKRSDGSLIALMRITSGVNTGQEWQATSASGASWATATYAFPGQGAPRMAALASGPVLASVRSAVTWDYGPGGLAEIWVSASAGAAWTGPLPSAMGGALGQQQYGGMVEMFPGVVGYAFAAEAPGERLLQSGVYFEWLPFGSPPLLPTVNAAAFVSQGGDVIANGGNVGALPAGYTGFSPDTVGQTGQVFGNGFRTLAQNLIVQTLLGGGYTTIDSAPNEPGGFSELCAADNSALASAYSVCLDDAGNLTAAVSTLGAWSSLTAYQAGNRVSDSGNYYFSLQNGNLAHNPIPTTLSGNLSSTATSMGVVSGTGYDDADVVLIDDEEVLIGAGGGGATLSTLTRGYNSTTPAAHSSGANVLDTSWWQFKTPPRLTPQNALLVAPQVQGAALGTCGGDSNLGDFGFDAATNLFAFCGVLPGGSTGWYEPTQFTNVLTPTTEGIKIQTAVPNGYTAVNAVPNGSGNTALLGVGNTNDPNNAGFLQIEIDGNDVTIGAAASGTGTAPTNLQLRGFALPSATATTQATSDASVDVATDAFVQNAIAAAAVPAITGGAIACSGANPHVTGVSLAQVSGAWVLSATCGP